VPFDCRLDGKHVVFGRVVSPAAPLNLQKVRESSSVSPSWDSPDVVQARFFPGVGLRKFGCYVVVVAYIEPALQTV
jgi:hypothetical protein